MTNARETKSLTKLELSIRPMKPRTVAADAAESDKSARVVIVTNF